MTAPDEHFAAAGDAPVHEPDRERSVDTGDLGDVENFDTTVDAGETPFTSGGAGGGDAGGNPAVDDLRP